MKQILLGATASQSCDCHYQQKKRAPQRVNSCHGARVLQCYAGRHNAGGLGGNGGGGFPSATILCRFTDIDPATAARPATSRVTTSKRFMFFSKLI